MSEHTPPLNVAPARAMVLQEAGEFQANTTATSPRENQWIQALRAGDETAFVSLLEQYDASLLRMALIYVPNLAVAQEVVQETWLAMLRGLNQFEGRSSLGSTFQKSASFRKRRVSTFARRSTAYPGGSARSSSCGISRGGPPTRCVTF